MGGTLIFDAKSAKGRKEDKGIERMTLRFERAILLRVLRIELRASALKCPEPLRPTYPTASNSTSKISVALGGIAPG